MNVVMDGVSTRGRVEISCRWRPSRRQWRRCRSEAGISESALTWPPRRSSTDDGGRLTHPWYSARHGPRLRLASPHRGVAPSASQDPAPGRLRFRAYRSTGGSVGCFTPELELILWQRRKVPERRPL